MHGETVKLIIGNILMFIFILFLIVLTIDTYSRGVNDTNPCITVTPQIFLIIRWPQYDHYSQTQVAISNLTTRKLLTFRHHASYV